MGASDHEFSGGVDMQFDVVAPQGADFFGQIGLDAGNQHVFYIASDHFEHLCVGFLLALPLFRKDEVVVLG